MQLSVIIPVFNEEKTVLTIIKRLLKQKEVHEIIVVNDGSTDRTQQLLSIIEKRESITKKLKMFHKKNEGKGSAVRLGLTKVTGTHVLIQDADLEYDPDDIPQLIAPIKKGKAEIVYGSRFLGPHLNLLFWHRVGNSVLNFLVNILYNTTLSDMETCYKVIPVSLLVSLNLQQNDFRIEPEITCKLLKKGYKIYEVPISYSGRDFSEGKKITWWDGVLAVGTIVTCRFK